jgi:hypothetical protein
MFNMKNVYVSFDFERHKKIIFCGKAQINISSTVTVEGLAHAQINFKFQIFLKLKIISYAREFIYAQNEEGYSIN